MPRPQTLPYPHILATLRTARWAATPSTAQAILDALRAHTRGASVERIGEVAAAMSAPHQASPVAGVAVVPVHGIIGKHLSQMETACGGRDVDAIAADISAAVESADVTAILLDLASPGGTVTGVPELAAKIRAWGARKPIYAFTSDQCCSAAYWIASACSSVFATPTAVVGSIGVYVAMIDDSNWFEKQGYKLELIKAGTFKAAGISGAPLADDARAAIQADVDSIYGMFVADVTGARPAVTKDTMQGQVFRGSAAITAGLVDAILPDLNAAAAAVVKDLASASAPQPIQLKSVSPGSIFLDTPEGRLQAARAEARAKARAVASKSPPAPAAKSSPIPAPVTKPARTILPPAPKSDAEAFATYAGLSRADRTAWFAVHGDATWRGFIDIGRRRAR